jgi:hypothetical protein
MHGFSFALSSHALDGETVTADDNRMTAVAAASAAAGATGQDESSMTRPLHLVPFERIPFVIAIGHQLIQCEQLSKGLILGAAKEARSKSVSFGVPKGHRFRTLTGRERRHAVNTTSSPPAQSLTVPAGTRSYTLNRISD